MRQTPWVPPSQYQLHLQFIVLSEAYIPTMWPCHSPFPDHIHREFLEGVHFTKMRFFPFDYVHKLLKWLKDAKMEIVIGIRF